MAISATNKKILRISHIVMILLDLVLIFAGLYLVMSDDMERAYRVYVIDVALDLFGMIIVLIFLIALYMEKHPGHTGRAMIQLFSLVALGMFSDLCIWEFDAFPERAPGLVFFNFLYYSCVILIAARFFIYIKAEFKLTKGIYQKLSWVVFAVVLTYLISLVFNLFLGFNYVVTPESTTEFGPFSFINYVVPSFLALLTLGVVLVQRIHYLEKLVVLSYMVMPILAVTFQVFNDDLSLTLPSILLGILLIYNTIYLRRSRQVIEQENQLVKQSTALMISQIQPHFLYNTLTTISNLCTKDPEEAEETTILFSRYLRTNLDSLRTMEPVPFTQEMDHIRIYLELEKKRFGDKLNIEYDIQDTAFTVPSLGLQPIAENSVKHGIRGKEEPGCLKISSHRIDKGHQVIIEDDGVGFDPNAPIREDGRSHVGMQNVRDRLRNMCGATMEITSSPGCGCRTVITFPDK